MAVRGVTDPHGDLRADFLARLEYGVALIVPGPILDSSDDDEGVRPRL